MMYGWRVDVALPRAGRYTQKIGAKAVIVAPTGLEPKINRVSFMNYEFIDMIIIPF